VKISFITIQPVAISKDAHSYTTKKRREDAGLAVSKPETASANRSPYFTSIPPQHTKKPRKKTIKPKKDA